MFGLEIQLMGKNHKKEPLVLNQIYFRTGGFKE